MIPSEFREDWIIRQARQRPSAERAAFLDGACAGDEALRQRVEAVLAAGKQSNDSFGSTAIDPAAEAQSTVLPHEERPGDVIGRYRLLEKIGEGGFGAVYAAEQREPVKRRVALKIIKLGMDTRQVVARFESERQALALMDHPNIAKVLDGGATEAGRPYFVMELVRGIAITKYCDDNHLPTDKRLKLFIQVCQAIQHAHQKGIIHRDIKPSNILVTVNDGVPVPKVIDFGIAKATQQELTDKTVYTQLQQFIGTPAYMSPEQAEMSALDIDTRSDIYSLGVLLYELLVGHTPFEARDLLQAGLDAMRRTIREKEPVRPSTRLGALSLEDRTTTARRRAAEAPKLISLLRGDLDWIVMRCLEKDRTLRYDTANGVAMDVQRHLNEEPVVARPPSNWYRLQKLARRNKVAFAAIAAVAIALLLGMAASTWEAVRATRAEQRESRSRIQAEGAQRQAVQAQQQAQRNLYAADMLLASQAWGQGNLGRLRSLIAKYDPSADTGPTNSSSLAHLRGWEWYFLSEQCHGDELFVLRGHSNAVPFALFINEHTACSFGSDQTLKFWDLKTRTATESIRWSDRPRRAAVSPDGHFVAAAGDFCSWAVWDATSRERVLQHTNRSGISGVAFSPDNHRIALTDGENVELWDILSRQLVRKFSRRNPGGDVDFVAGLAFSPDGHSLAYPHSGNEIRVRDLATATELTIGKSAGGGALGLAFSPDGKVLVSSDRIRITVWDLTGQSSPRHLTNHLEQCVFVAFSADGRLLASASGDQTIKLWRTEDWQEITTLRGHEHEVHGLGFSPSGKLLISSSKDGTVRVWQTDQASPLNDRFAWPGPAFWLFNAAGTNLLVEQGNILSAFDLRRLVIRWSETIPPGFFDSAFWEFSPTGDTVAAALRDGSVDLWRARPLGKWKTVIPGPAPVTALTLGKTGNLLAVQGTNHTAELWNLTENRLVQTLPPFPIWPDRDTIYHSLSFWSDDKLIVRVSPRADGLIEITSVPDGKRRLIRHTHKDDISNLAISRDGTKLATAGWDAQVKLWDVQTGLEIDTLRGQLVGFMGVTFSPDGTRLAAGGWDGSITLWDVETRLQVCHWKAHAISCHWLAFIEGGRTLVSCGDVAQNDGRQEMRLWHAPSLPATASQ